MKGINGIKPGPLFNRMNRIYRIKNKIVFQAKFKAFHPVNPVNPVDFVFEGLTAFFAQTL
jgi:hypothetical protein